MTTLSSVVKYLAGDTNKLRQVFIWATAIQFSVYVLWQIVTLGSFYSTIFTHILAEHAGLNGLILAVREVFKTSYIELAIRLFADLALATSFLGVTLGLFDYLADIFKSNNTMSGRAQTGILTFVPPLLFALFYPGGFIVALGYAAIALTVLALLLPSMLAWRIRLLYDDSKYNVAGGIPLLILVFACGIAIIVIQLALVAGWLSSAG